MRNRSYKLAFKAVYSAGIEDLYPRNNFVGTLLLHRLLRLRFESAGLLDDGCAVSGELNACFGVVVVSDLSRAVDLLKKELLAIVPQSRIAWHDEAEGIWRFIHPHEICGSAAVEFISTADCEEALRAEQTAQSNAREFLRLIAKQKQWPRK